MFTYQTHFREGKILQCKTKLSMPNFSEDSPFLSIHSSTVFKNGNYMFFMSSLSKARNPTTVKIFFILNFFISKKLTHHLTYIPLMNFYNFLVNFYILSSLSHKPRRMPSLLYFSVLFSLQYSAFHIYITDFLETKIEILKMLYLWHFPGNDLILKSKKGFSVPLALPQPAESSGIH